MRSKGLALSGAPSQVSTRKPPRTVNKGECCRHFRWTRHEFDRKVREGVPVVEAAAKLHPLGALVADLERCEGVLHRDIRGVVDSRKRAGEAVEARSLDADALASLVDDGLAVVDRNAQARLP